MTLAVIGGTGVYDPTWLRDPEEVTVATPFGGARLVQGALFAGGTPVYFMNRHGAGHQLPPHLVNYRANVWALRALGVTRVLATAAVGSLNPAMPPGSMVFCDQFLDFTKSRPTTFFDGGEAGVVHTDMTEPYCPDCRRVLAATAQTLGLPAAAAGTYVATEGPRFESPAEIRAYRILGGDLVGMTGVPEVVLARELGLCYAGVALVTNFAAGISQRALTHSEVLTVMADNVARLRTLLQTALQELAGWPRCECQATLVPLDGNRAAVDRQN